MLGKIKTWAQIIAVAALLLHNLPFELVSFPFGDIALWVAVLFTVISGWDYFAKNWDALKHLTKEEGLKDGNSKKQKSLRSARSFCSARSPIQTRSLSVKSWRKSV